MMRVDDSVVDELRTSIATELPKHTAEFGDRTAFPTAMAWQLRGSGHPEEPYTWESPVHQRSRSTASGGGQEP